MGFRDNVSFSSPGTPASPLEDRMRTELRSHPKQQDTEKSFFDDYHVKARYGMFDLSQTKDVEELEKVISQIMARKKILRQEKWAHDKDGLTIVTLSWLDLVPKKKKDEDKDPEGVPTFEDTP